MSDSRYATNEPQVAAEDIDGEVVIVSFATGHYFSLRGTSADVWRMLASGARVSEIVDRYSVEAGGGDGEISRVQELSDFVSQLIAEGLVVDDGSSTAPKPDLSLQSVEPYETPVLERFDEMKEMLLYDPIHDVDETGWPHLPKAQGDDGAAERGA